MYAKGWIPFIKRIFGLGKANIRTEVDSASAVSVVFSDVLTTFLLMQHKEVDFVKYFPEWELSSKKYRDIFLNQFILNSVFIYGART